MSYTLRLLPCSKYDNEVMESWLEDLALQGLILKNIVCGIAIFQKQEPQKLRYRLSIIPAEKWDVYEDVSGEDEFIAFCEASGWKFICKRGLFGIFMTADETLEELHTEPELQYLDMKGYMDWRSIMEGSIPFWVTCLMFSNWYRWGIFSDFGITFAIAMAAIMIVCVVDVVYEVTGMLALYRKLKANGISHEKKEWRDSAIRHRALVIVVVLVYTIGLGYGISLAGEMFAAL